MLELLARRARPCNLCTMARHSGARRNPVTLRSDAMLLLFILIGLLALGLPLMMFLMADPPPPVELPVKPKAAVVQPAPVAAPVEVPHAAGSESAPSAPAAPAPGTTAASPQGTQTAIPGSTAASPAATALPAVPATSPAASQPSTPAGETASMPGLPEGAKLPSEAELLKELQRLLNERAQSGK